MDAPFPPGMLEDITAFLEQAKDLPPGRDVYPEVFQTALFFPLQRQQELAAMMRIARSVSPQVVAEIGCDKGSGLYHWCKSLPSVKGVIACEIRGLPYAALFEQAFPDLDFLWLPRSSYAAETVLQVSEFLGYEGAIDCLFLDGDKAAYLKDFDAYLPLMNPQGIVFLHDIRDSPGPREAFTELRRRGYRTERIVLLAEAVAATAREARGVPASCPHEGWLRHWQGRSAGVGVVYLGDRA